MKKSIAILMFCSLAFWACDSSKKADESSTTTPATTVANTPEKAPKKSLMEVESNDHDGHDHSAHAGNVGKFKFEEESFDFGTIKQGDVVEHTFKFTNVGEHPLVINNIKASCGCTTPSWPKEPIAPGADGEILVKFNSKGKMGQQNKIITITANVEGGTDKISIRTLIEKGEDTANMMGPVKE